MSSAFRSSLQSDYLCLLFQYLHLLFCVHREHRGPPVRSRSEPLGFMFEQYTRKSLPRFTENITQVKYTTRAYDPTFKPISCYEHYKKRMVGFFHFVFG